VLRQESSRPLRPSQIISPAGTNIPVHRACPASPASPAGPACPASLACPERSRGERSLLCRFSLEFQVVFGVRGTGRPLASCPERSRRARRLLCSAGIYASLLVFVAQAFVPVLLGFPCYTRSPLILSVPDPNFVRVGSYHPTTPRISRSSLLAFASLHPFPYLYVRCGKTSLHSHLLHNQSPSTLED
jgi:hypothetical protein